MKDAIVAYIDVLGYGDFISWLSNNKQESELTKVAESLYKQITHCLKEIESIKDALVETYPDDKDYLSNLFKSIDIRLISDTILFILRLPDAARRTPARKDGVFNPLTDPAALFLQFILFFCPTFIKNTGFLLRGAIAKGYHDLKDFGSIAPGAFIFSAAYVKAFYMEKEIAVTPRIILEQDIVNHLKSIKFSLNDYSYIDPDDERYCLDIYHFICPQSRKFVQDLKEAIVYNTLYILPRKDDPVKKQKVRDKLKYFAAYHNEKVRKSGLDLDTYGFDMSLLNRRI